MALLIMGAIVRVSIGLSTFAGRYRFYDLAGRRVAAAHLVFRQVKVGELSEERCEFGNFMTIYS